MLLFFRIPEARLADLRAHGLRADGTVRLHSTLAAARADGKGSLVVVDTSAMPEPPEEMAAEGGIHFAPIPAEAFVNLDPYCPPRPVSAAGGYVLRAGAGAMPEVLLIHRLGVWDLPKGKRDKGESIEACARREVCEEIGIEAVQITRPLGTTLHGYVRKRRYDVKTTHWFAMTTDATDFTPQAEEDIRAVEWVPWTEAKARLGYATLRAHMAAIEADIRAM